MSKLVSPEELHKFFMIMPPAQLAKERYAVKAHLNQTDDQLIKSNKISKENSNLISNRLFEAVLIYNLNQKLIADQTGLPFNDVARLSSENQFVSQESFETMMAYLDQVEYWKGPKPNKNLMSNGTRY